MKRRIKVTLIAVFSAMAFVTAVVGSSRTLAIGSDKPASPIRLYVQNCARCHGSDGRANTPMGRKVDAANLTDADVKSKSVASISRAIKNGRPGMPAFGKRFTPAQISSIAGYVKSL